MDDQIDATNAATLGEEAQSSVDIESAMIAE
jgi:hypothetical protein